MVWRKRPMLRVWQIPRWGSGGHGGWRDAGSVSLHSPPGDKHFAGEPLNLPRTLSSTSEHLGLIFSFLSIAFFHTRQSGRWDALYWMDRGAAGWRGEGRAPCLSVRALFERDITGGRLLRHVYINNEKQHRGRHDETLELSRFQHWIWFPVTALNFITLQTSFGPFISSGLSDCAGDNSFYVRCSVKKTACKDVLDNFLFFFFSIKADKSKQLNQSKKCRIAESRLKQSLLIMLLSIYTFLKSV